MSSGMTGHYNVRLVGQSVSAYRFLTEAARRAEPRLRIPELNSGFEPVYWCGGQDITLIRQDQHGCYVEWEGDGQIPLTYMLPVASEGNYKVQLCLYAEREIENAMIFLGRRRLAWRGRLKEGEQWTGSFVTNICPIIPRTYTELMKDLTLDVTIIGTGLHLTEITAEAFAGRTLYIAGDSTVTDQSADYPYLPGSSYCGWGQMLSAYLPSEMTVSNHAHSGLTTESFRSEGHYQILLDRIKKDDFCLFQFGHNDQKLMHLMAEEGYRRNLLRYIAEIRDRGAIPILVTPLARNSWKGNDGSYNDLLKPYAQACIRIGQEQRVPVIELHQRSMELIMTCGCEQAKRYFYPSDYTHSNDYGALRFAGFVYEGLVKEGLLGGTVGIQDCFCWEPPERILRPTIPEKYQGVENPDTEKLFEGLERPNDYLTRAEALELVITAMHFFPTNVYNDMFTDVIGHERYAGIVECAWQNGLIPDGMVRDHKIHPLKDILGGEFMELLRNGYLSRKAGEEDIKGILPAGFEPNDRLRRGTAADMCRKLQI